MEEFDTARRRRFREQLRRWYEQQGRKLPWRGERDPYRVWIREIMLQQTTVTAVVPYLERFFQTFPDVQTLSKAEESEVLRLWEGLGYYSRARNIHRTARLLVEQYDGEFPDDPLEIVNLPGIGRYTAGAIASFAFDRPAPIVEANTLRLYSRLLGYSGDPRSTKGQQQLWSFAEAILPRKNCGTFNQALIDLGATVCAPADPQCPVCPVKSCCDAFQTGRQQEIPLAKKRPVITDVTEAAIAVERDGEYFLCQRPEGVRWAGLWDFPRFDVTAADSAANGRSLRRVRDDLAANLKTEFAMEVEVEELLTKIRHSVTRYRIQLLCFSGSLLDRQEPTQGSTPQRVWIPPKSFADYPLSVTGRKFADLLVKER